MARGEEQITSGKSKSWGDAFACELLIALRAVKASREARKSAVLCEAKNRNAEKTGHGFISSLPCRFMRMWGNFMSFLFLGDRFKYSELERCSD